VPTTGHALRGPRSLLRQIREAMAGEAPAQVKLSMVVRTIAVSMVAEVCSIYLRRASGEMELFATEGLDPGAVHTTQLKPGEGLIGEIMRIGRPLNLSDAPSHPAFSYRPETREDPFHAFLGVPLLRGGRSIGVLVVQNRTSRIYAEDDVEDLQIIAMVLAETVAAGNLLSREELKDVEIAPRRPERLKGTRLADGLAFGVAVAGCYPTTAPPKRRACRRPSPACRSRSTPCSRGMRVSWARPTTCSKPIACWLTVAAGTTPSRTRCIRA